MRLDSQTLLRLRDELRRTGERRTMPPAAPEVVTQVPADVLAVVQRVAPLCEVLYLLMVADDHTDQRELEVLRGAIRALTEGQLRSSVIDGMLERFQANVDAYGRDQRMAQVAALLSADRQDAEAAFTLAAVMVIADEHPDAQEQSLLEELRQQLGVSDKRASVLLGELGLG